MKKELEQFSLGYAATGPFLELYLKQHRNPDVFNYLSIFIDGTFYMGSFPNARRVFEDKCANFKAIKSMSDKQIMELANEAHSRAVDMQAAARMIR